jgi:hypothetical protein
MDQSADPPLTPSKLTARHLDRYWLDRCAAVSERTVIADVRTVGRVFREIQPPNVQPNLIAEEVMSWLDLRRSPGVAVEPPSGYSDREFGAIGRLDRLA